MAVFDLSHIKEVEKATKLQNKSLFFKSALLILTVSTKASHSTNLFCSFSHYQAPNHTQPTISLDSLRRRANARNVSFRIFLRWLTVYIINPVESRFIWLVLRENSGSKATKTWYDCLYSNIVLLVRADVPSCIFMPFSQLNSFYLLVHLLRTKIQRIHKYPYSEGKLVLVTSSAGSCVLSSRNSL